MRKAFTSEWQSWRWNYGKPRTGGNLYSVTQSYANSFCGDVVLDTFNNVSRDEDNILDQIYIKQICPDFYYDDFWFA